MPGKECPKACRHASLTIRHARKRSGIERLDSLGRGTPRQRTCRGSLTVCTEKPIDKSACEAECACRMSSRGRILGIARRFAAGFLIQERGL